MPGIEKLHLEDVLEDSPQVCTHGLVGVNTSTNKTCIKLQNLALSVFTVTVENILFSTNAIYPMGMQAHLEPLSGMNMYQHFFVINNELDKLPLLHIILTLAHLSSLMQAVGQSHISGIFL